MDEKVQNRGVVSDLLLNVMSAGRWTSGIDLRDLDYFIYPLVCVKVVLIVSSLMSASESLRITCKSLTVCTRILLKLHFRIIKRLA